MNTLYNDNYYFHNNTSPTLDKDRSEFYFQPNIDGARFSKLYPYQLLILTTIQSEDKKVRYEQTPYSFTLPIPPQELSVNTPIATTLQATLNGVVEQHGGAPFKDILFSGTTGFTPIKNETPSLQQQGKVLGAIGAIFAGTSNAITRAINDSSSNSKPINKNNGLTNNILNNDSILEKSTGYYQFKLLEKFLESYSLLKKKSGSFTDPITGYKIDDTKDIRLALAIWKDQEVYLCSGVQFTRKRSATSPMEYRYTLALKAWKRIQLDSSPSAFEYNYVPVARNPNAYSQLINRLSNSTQIIQDNNQILNSVIQDVSNRVNEITRQVLLNMKSTANLDTAIADYPDTIKAELLPVLVKNWNLVSDQVKDIGGIPPSIFITGISKLLGVQTNPTDVSLNQIPTNLISKKQINKIFQTIKPSDLPLTTSLLQKIEDEKERISSFTRLDFEKMRNNIKNFSTNFADSVGCGSSQFNSIYNRPNIVANKTPTDDDFDILFALNEVCQVLDYLAASSTINSQTPTSLEYVAGLAEKSGIAFNIPKSKFSVPFPYGFTLERLAKLYLNDANRWHEIATLNGLREPYVDEVGFILPFLTNGDGNTLYVSDASNLYINQTIYLSSNTKPLNKRHIISIKQVYPKYFSVEVDGDSDLDEYLTSGNAQIQAYLPGTVNSQQVIYIPSDSPAPSDPQTKGIPGIDIFDPLLQVSGVDLLLTSNGDLAITPDGDCKLAYGLQNIVQTVKIAISTPQGSLLHHPHFGIKIPVGTSIADIDLNELKSIIQSMFSNDSTFSGVSSIDIRQNGGSITIFMSVQIAALNMNIPLTLTLN